MSKLFDEEDELNEEIPAEILEEENSSKHQDKIFDNDYNSGNIDFEEYGLPRVDSFYAEDNLQDCYDSYEYKRKQDLEFLVDEYFMNTEIGKIFSTKKKLPKQVLPQMFVSIREQFTGNDFTASEIFTAIAEYFGISYDVLYENIPSVYRVELVKELDDKYDILKRKGMKKLF